MRYKIQYILCALCLPFLLIAQVEELSPPDFIKTITFKSNTTQGQLPVLRLGESLVLEFDALNPDEEDFYYIIEHFNFDWTPSKG